MNREAIVQTLIAKLQAAPNTPKVMAIYAFGSRINGQHSAESDLDLAVLVEGYADVVSLFNLSGELSDIAECPVDLLDLRAASTVMQYQVVTNGQRWWCHRRCNTCPVSPK